MDDKQKEPQLLNRSQRRQLEDGSVEVVGKDGTTYLVERTVFKTPAIDKDGKPVERVRVAETLHSKYVKVRGKKARAAEKKARRAARS